MAQEVKIAGALFSNVPSIQVPDSNDVYHSFVDPSTTTATAADVKTGKTFYNASGTETTGTGASTITSTYSNGTVTLNTEDVSVAWWGGLNPEFLYETTCECVLSDTNYSSLTPKTTAQTMKYPAMGYTTSANTNPIYDRWGSAYHGGAKLDFRYYDYFILNDTMVDIAYTSSESSLGVVHSVKHTATGLHTIGQRFRVSGGNIITPTESTYGTTTAFTLVYPTTFYRNASNTLYVGASSSYGIYPAPAVPTFQSTASLYSNYINFRAPSWSIRANNTYMIVGAYTYVDASNTKLKNRQRLYRVRKKDVTEIAYSRHETMWTDGVFPTEVI